MIAIHLGKLHLAVARNTNKPPFRLEWAYHHCFRPWHMLWTPCLFVMAAWYKRS